MLQKRSRAMSFDEELSEPALSPSNAQRGKKEPLRKHSSMDKKGGISLTKIDSNVSKESKPSGISSPKMDEEDSASLTNTNKDYKMDPQEMEEVKEESASFSDVTEEQIK